MQQFFESIDTLHQFSLNLNYHKEKLHCHTCAKSDQFVSHGFLYKKQSQGKRIETGKRIICSRRYGRSGCGATTRLTVANHIPSLHYTALQIYHFLIALMANASIQVSYQHATGQSETRNAYRWLNKIEGKLIEYRSVLKTRTEPIEAAFINRTRRLRLLLPTLQRLFSLFDHSPCSHYQRQRQMAFM